MFRIRVQENEQVEEFLAATAKAVWYQVVSQIDSLRRKHGLVKMFPTYIVGEELFGLTVNDSFSKSCLQKSIHIGTTYYPVN